MTYSIKRLRHIIKLVLSEQGHLSKVQVSGMGTNQSFTTKSTKVSLGSPSEYSIEGEKDENAKEKVKISKVFLK